MNDKVRVTGTVIECLRGGWFRIRLTNGHVLLGYPCGKMRQARGLKIILDDTLEVDVDPTDWSKGIIKWRHT